MITLNVNGQPREIDVDPATPILWVVRENLEMTGTKFGCGIAQCGACTVHVDGQPTRSCSLPLSAVGEKQVSTVEALAQTPVGKALQEAWLEDDVMQCGYCQAGQLMNAAALLTSNPNPSDGEIDAAMQGNICRCACYKRIHAAIAKVARDEETVNA